METLSKEEANAMLLLTSGREIAVSSRLKSLQPGEALVVKRSEWKTKYAPSKIARRIEKQDGWKFRTGRLADNSGWMLQRLA